MLDFEVNNLEDARTFASSQSYSILHLFLKLQSSPPVVSQSVFPCSQACRDVFSEVFFLASGGFFSLALDLAHRPFFIDVSSVLLILAVSQGVALVHGCRI